MMGSKMKDWDKVDSDAKDEEKEMPADESSEETEDSE